MQNSKTIWLIVHHHSWISFSGNICVLPSTFDHMSFWRCSGNNIANDTILHRLHLPLVSCSPTSGLASWNSCNCSIEMVEDPIMTSHVLSELYHMATIPLKFLQLFPWNGRGPHHDITSLIWIIPPRNWWLHGICQSQAKILESGQCWSTNLSGRGMSILAKTFEQLMLPWDLVIPHN